MLPSNECYLATPADGSDEVGCGWCESSEFSCGLLCIPSYAVCDGSMDCENGEDEEGSICSEFQNISLCLSKELQNISLFLSILARAGC